MLYLHSILNGIYCIEQDAAMNYLPIIASWMKGNANPIQSKILTLEERATSIQHAGIMTATLETSSYSISEWGKATSPENAPTDSVAIICINGAVTRYDQDCGPAGMQTKADILKRCYANDNIKSVILVTDTPGGDPYAAMLMAETISMKNKPVIGFIDCLAASAGYWMLSPCDMIIANRSTARVGSIGAYATILSYKRWFEANDIDLIEVYSSMSENKNAPFREALKGNEKPLKDMIDVICQAFIDDVMKYRVDEDGNSKLKTPDNWNKGDILYADKALEEGLIDGIDSLENVINYFNT